MVLDKKLAKASYFDYIKTFKVKFNVPKKIIGYHNVEKSLPEGFFGAKIQFSAKMKVIKSLMLF